MRFPSIDRYQKRCEEIDRIESWHKWFAWYPVRISTLERAWLETVERKGTWFSQLGWSFEYRSAPTPVTRAQD